jgi:hypothetical protein
MSTSKDYHHVIHGDQGVNKHHSAYCSVVVVVVVAAAVFIIYVTCLLLTSHADCSLLITVLN